MADRPEERTPARKPSENNLPSPSPLTQTNSGPKSPSAGISLPSPSPSHGGHRGSFAESMRGVVPHSPRASRQSSLSQQALQDLLNNPPTKGRNSAFHGRDWKTVKVGEVVDQTLVRFTNYDASVEEATKLLIEGGPPNVVLLREDASTLAATGTFDYSDLNAYLLLIVGLTQPPEDFDPALFEEIRNKGRQNEQIPLRSIKGLVSKEPLITLPHTADLTKAIEVFGSGIHRILVVEEGSTDVVGVLTQLRLVRFFWDNRQSFPRVDELYPELIKDLHIGSPTVLAINGDKPLTDALELMHSEGISSLPVLDAQNNVIGNISQVDVRLLTKSTSLPLLRSSCIHFISVILSERGVHDGKDSFPVFHVHPFSTLAHTVAKLVATRSHRMWVVETPSPASSGPPTPALGSSTTISAPAVVVPPSPITPLPTANQPFAASPGQTNPAIVAPAVSASALPGASLSGRLSGVISLTDVLNLFARASGLHPHDPDEARRARRRSSSSSMRRSVDSSRSESMSAPVGRRSSVSERNAVGLGFVRGRGV